MKIIIYFESREINIYEVTEQITKSNWKTYKCYIEKLKNQYWGKKWNIVKGNGTINIKHSKWFWYIM